jgi:hypothetical protein
MYSISKPGVALRLRPGYSQQPLLRLLPAVCLLFCTCGQGKFLVTILHSPASYLIRHQ